MFRVVAPLMLLVALASSELTLSQSAIDAFLDVHNGLRRDTGANMPDLQWSSTLAQYAAERVNQCAYQHDQTRKYGENLYYASWAVDGETGANDASVAWGSEIADVDSEWKCAYGQADKMCGHYTQQVWSSTTKIGCAVNHCSGSSLVFCEYDPPGNTMGYNWRTGQYIYTPPY